MQDFFESNLCALKIIDKTLAQRLESVVPNAKYEVFLTNDALNFNIISRVDSCPIFPDSPIQYTNQKILDFMAFAQYPYLYFFGLGNGVFHKVLLQNENLKCAVIIEPEIEILFIVLHFLDFSQEILQRRVVFLDKDSNAQDVFGIFINDKHKKIYAKLYDLHIFNGFYERFKDICMEFNRYFINAIEHVVISVGNDSKDSVIGITHHIQTLPQMLRSPTLASLIQELRVKRSEHFESALGAKGSSAVIVSTGPSLNKQLSLLKKYQDFVTIFCIDASLPILAREGIKPDVVFSLERVDLTARFYEDTPKSAHKDVIFAITSITHERLRNALDGDMVQYNMRPFGYTYYFGFDEYGYIGVGMSAANMAYEMVVYARFKRCIIIGQDLSFAKDGSSHAKDSVYGANEIDPKQRKDKVQLEAYGGKGMVESTSIWKLFLEFYQTDIAQTPYPIEVINATEGGVRILGTKEMGFKEALQGLEKGGKKEPLILHAPSPSVIESNIAKAKKKIEKFIDFGMSKKSKVEEVFLEVASLTEELEEVNKKGLLEEFDFSKITCALEHIQEIKDFFNDEQFTMCFNDAIQSYIVHQEMEIAKIITRISTDDIALKAKQIDLLYAHKYWLFSLAGGIDCVLEVVKKAFENWNLDKAGT